MDRFGGTYGGLGGLLGPPGSQIADIHPHGMDEVGCEKRWVSLAILGQEDGSLPTLKVVKENWVALVVCMAVWGVPGVPDGRSMPPWHG